MRTLLVPSSRRAGGAAALAACVAWAALAGFQAPCGGAPEAAADPLTAEDFRYAPLSKEIVAGWEAEWAQVGYMARNAQGTPLFRFLEEGPLEALPGFSVDLKNASSLTRVPHPGRAFGMRLNAGSQTNESLQSLVRFNTLELLHLQLGREVDAAAVAKLAELPRLEALTLYLCPASAEQLRAAARIPSLRTLGLHELETTNEAVAEVAAAKGLRLLSLDGIGVGDGVLPTALRLPKLEALVFGEEATITDAGVAKLEGRALRRLRLPPTARTALGLKHYVAALAPDAPLDLVDWEYTADLLPELRRIPPARLAAATIGVVGASKADLVPLAALPGLEGLKFFEDGASLSLEERLAAVAGAVRLRRLDVTRADLGGKVMERIAAFPALEELVFTDAGGKDLDFAPLAALSKLRRVKMDHMQTKDRLPRGLTEVKQLEELWIDLPDAQIAELAALPRLRRIRIAPCEGLTDAAAARLAALPALEMVSFLRAPVSRAAMLRAGFEPKGLDYKRRRP